NAASVRPTVLANLEPNDIRFVSEAPCFHHAQAFHQQRIWAPQIKMRLGSREGSHGQFRDFLEFHGRITQQAAMLWRDFTRAVLELPRWIGQNGRKLALDLLTQINSWSWQRSANYF